MTRLQKAITGFAMVMVLWTALFGVIHTIGIGSGQKMDCPFMPGHSLCMASVVQHLDHWRMTFVTILTAALLLVLIPIWRFVHLVNRETGAVMIVLKQYARNHTIPIRNFLQYAFAHGLLHRRVYA